MKSPRLVFCCVLICAGGLCAQASQTPFQQAATKVLREMPVKLYEGRATESDLQACLRLIELAPNDNAKRPFALLVAQDHRIALQKPERAMFNIGRKYELMGEEQTALTAMNAYIKKYPSGMYSRCANNFVSKMKGESSP